MTLGKIGYFEQKNKPHFSIDKGMTILKVQCFINIQHRSFRFLNGTGLILFRLNTEITNTTLPIIFSSNTFTQPLTIAGGNNATGTNIAGVGVYLIYYDKTANTMQLLTTV